MSIGNPSVQIALSLEALGPLPARDAITRAGHAGYCAIAIPALRRDFSPESLGRSGTRDLAAFLGKNNLAVSWLSAGARGRFAVSSMLEEDIAKVLSIIQLSGVLRAACVSVNLGMVGSVDSLPAENVRQALRALADEADRLGVTIALSASSGEIGIVDGLLAGFPDAPLGRLLDPARALFAGSDPVDETLRAGRVVAVRASDSSAEQADLAPGEGRVTWRDLLAALAARDYYGYLTVDFAPGGDCVRRAATARSVLFNVAGR